MGFLSIGALPRLLIKQMSITIPNFRAVPNWAGDFQKFIAENTILGAAAIQGLAICYPDGTTIEAETASIEAKRHRLKLTGVTVHSQGAETQKFGSGNIPLTGKSAGQLTRILEANANPSPTSQFTAEVTL